MSTLMTERRRPLDNDDGQESLFGGEAFAAGPPAPTPWEREHAAPAGPRAHSGPEATPHLPLDAGVSDVAPGESRGVESTPGTSAGEWAPLDEGQHLTGYEVGPSAADLAAYDYEVETAPTNVPAQDAGEELAALEAATVLPEHARGSRATLAGPTLDDVMSRAWEGLMTGLPAACPVCEGEVVPSFAGSVHGSCASCGTSIE
jgi:hypothetical protein